MKIFQHLSVAPLWKNKNEVSFGINNFEKRLHSNPKFKRLTLLIGVATVGTRLGLAIVPSYHGTIVSHRSVARKHNGQSKPGWNYVSFVHGRPQDSF